jgi:hypothetical protein
MRYRLLRRPGPAIPDDPANSTAASDDGGDAKAPGFGAFLRTILSWVAAALVIAALAAGCSASTARSNTRKDNLPPRDRDNVVALLRIAVTFNNDYDSGIYAPVYDRWDARSKAIIGRAEYIRRHTECPSAPATAHVEGARPGPQGEWLVSYEIEGVQLTDYWFYTDGRWQFDLPLSNPDSVKLYKLSGQQYVNALGCSH